MKGPRLGWWFVVGLMVFGWFLAPTMGMAENIYLMSTGYASADTAIINALTAFGHTVTLGVEKQNFNGSQSLAGYKVVILTDSYNYSSADMPNAGQTALLNFIDSGGGLITSEWTLWALYAYGHFSTLAPAFPAIYGGEYSHATSTTYTAQTSDPIMNYNLPGSFTFSLTNIGGTESKVGAKARATVFYNSSSTGGVGVAGWKYGNGRVINFSTLIALNELGDSNYRQLLHNAVTWVSGGGSALPSLGLLLLQ